MLVACSDAPAVGRDKVVDKEEVGKELDGDGFCGRGREVEYALSFGQSVGWSS